MYRHPIIPPAGVTIKHLVVVVVVTMLMPQGIITYRPHYHLVSVIVHPENALQIAGVEHIPLYMAHCAQTHQPYSKQRL